MTIGGISIILILGVVNFILIIFQLLSGFHVIKVPFTMHRKTGIVLCICAFAHAILALLASL